MDEMIISLIAASLSLLAGGAFKEVFDKLLRRKSPAERKPYSERLAELMGSLTTASKQVDALLTELSQVAKEREKAAAALESQLAGLENRESELIKKIQHLERVPLPAAEYLAEIYRKDQKRSAWRDYLLFGAGVILSTAIAVALNFFGLG